ncbi:hypothetical protein GCM10020001_108820 [Nonomuraea salmonea]
MTNAVVTGGSRGIGRAVVERLAGDGATVVFSYVADEAAARQVEQACGGRAVAVRADAADPAQVERLFEEAGTVFGGPLTALVSNAGVMDHTPVDAVTPEAFERVMAVNVRGAFSRRTCGGRQDGRRRAHRHDLLDRHRLAQRRRVAVRGEQGGRRAAHPRRLPRAGPARHHRQRGLAGPDRHRPAEGRRAAGGDGGGSPT